MAYSKEFESALEAGGLDDLIGYKPSSALPALPPEQGRKEGFFRGVAAGGVSALGGIPSAIGSVTGMRPDDTGGMRGASLAAERAASDIYQGPTWEEVKEKPFSDRPWEFVKGAVGQMAVPMAESVALGHVGRTLGMTAGAITGPAAPVAVPVLGAIGQISGMALPFVGYNVGRQTQEQEAAKARGEIPQEYQFGKAWATAPVQSAMEKFALGKVFRGTPVGRVLGETEEKLTEAQLRKIAEQGILKTMGKGAGRAVAAEVPVEIGQQAIERWQAGLDLTSPEAMREYEETIAGTIAGVSPIGAGTGVVRRVGARTQVRDLTKPTAITEEVAQPARDVRGVVPDMFTGEMRPPVNEYQAALEDAIRQTSATDLQGELFETRAQPTVGGVPLPNFGYGVAGRIVKPGREAKPEKAVKPKKLSPISEAQARVDAAFPVNSPAHIDASNILATATSKSRGKALAAVNKMISSAQKGEPYAGRIEKPSKGMLRAKGAQPEVEVGLPGVGEGYAQPEAIAGEGKAQAKRGARKVKPVATEPIPEMPILAEQLPEYEDNVRSYLTSGVDPINSLIVSKFHGTEEAGGERSSLEALARELKMSKQAIHKRLNKATGELQANAEAAGIPWDSAQQLLGIAPEAVDTGLVGEGAFEGGARAVRAPGEEFEPDYGMTREEAIGEQGVVEEEAAPAEEEVSTEEVLDVIAELDIAERLMNRFTPDETAMAAAAYGDGFKDLPVSRQMDLTIKISDLALKHIDSYDSFVTAVTKLKGKDYGKIGELGVGEKIPRGKEGVRERPAGRAEAERVGAEQPVVVGAKGAEGVKVTAKKRRAVMRSEGEEPKDTGNTVSTITENLRKVFFSPTKMDSVVSVVQTEDELPDAKEGQIKKSGTRGVYYTKTGKAWLIADNIPVGQELSVMLHEVGVHMGMRKLLGQENYTKLTDQLIGWYHTGTGKEKELIDLSVKRLVKAQKAQQDEAVAEAMADAKEAGVTLPESSIARIRRAAKLSDEIAAEELLAYFVEEAVIAGIQPTAMEGLSKEFKDWIRALWLAVSRALRKLGIDIKSLTAQDVVDLAYGAAHMELRRGGEPEVLTPVEAVTTKYKSEQLFDKAEQFIKKTGDYHTIRVEKQESGEVWATRIPVERPDKMFSMAATSGMSIPESVAWNEKTIKKAIKDQAKHALDVGLDKVMFTEDLVERAVKRGLTTAKEFGRLMSEKMATRDSIEQSVANIMSRAHDLPQAEKDAASEFIRKSTTEQKWGYVPEWAKDAVVDQGMKSAFNKLSPMAQAVVKDVFKFGEETHARLQTAVNQDINNEFDELLKTAETPEAKADIESRRAAKIAQVGKIMPKLEGPYAPLKRFGNHVMVAMSKEYAEAKKSDDKSAMEQMQSDERHLLVEHFDTRAEAVARTDQLRDLYKGGSVETWTKQESFKHVSELPWAGIAKVKAAIEGLPEGSKYKNALQNMLTDLYLSMMSETSARKSELARKNIAGANKDMFRAFASQGSATAHFITSLENSGDVSRAITQMQTDAREGEAGTRSDRTAVLNELTSRFAQSLEYSQTPMVNRALKATSFWMLMTSPAFYVQNSLQPFMITVPYLAGRFGANRSWREMTKAYKDIAKYTISAKSHQLDVTTLPNVTDKEKEMLKEMQKYGKLDLTIMQDVGRYTEGESVLDKGLFGNVMRKIWAGPQRVELLNRVASALAAYRLATGTEEQKLAYTGDVISKTHGNYSSFNAPRFFTSSGAMRLITQFRKFQLIQLTLLTRLTHDAFKGASVEERAVARRALYWLLGQHAVMTGSLGLPIPAVVWAVAASLGSGDDEPEDYEQWLRNLIDDEDAANLLLRGVPAYFGLNMSQRIGMGSTFSALPFADIPKDRAGYEKFMTAALGASAGLGGQWFDALGKMGKGDYYKGVETALPSGLKNMMRGYRISTEGVTSNAGDTLIKPEDVSLVDALAQGVGLPTMTISERQRKQGVVIEATKFYNERSSDLKRDYVKAYKAKDTEAMAEAREAWKQLQASRAAVGFKRQPLGDLIKAPLEQKKRERAAARGIEYTTQTKGFVERLV